MASRSSQVGVIVARYGRRLRQHALRVTGSRWGNYVASAAGPQLTRTSITSATYPQGRCQSRASAARRLANRAATPEASEERTLSRPRSRRPRCQTGGRVSVKSTRSSMATSPPSDASMRRRLPLSRAIPIRGLPPAWWTITGRSRPCHRMRAK